MKLISVIWKSILGLVTALAVLGLVSTLMETGDNREYYRDSALTIDGFALGPVEEPCDLGYQAYEIQITVRNDSRFGAEEGAVWRTYDGPDYDDVRQEDPGRYTSLTYAGNRIIPAGRQTVLTDRIYVKNGTGQITVSYSAGYQDDTHTQTLSVPVG